MVSALLLLVAVILEVLAALGAAVSGVELVPAGLAFAFAALLLDHVPARVP